jgi:hypothetical protein
MSKLIKRADGSYSKRGLWDNIRANKGSGKKPTKQMLEQERKIKKEEKMKMKYEKGGKKSTAKKSFMEDSKEIKFGAPGVKFSMSEKEGEKDDKKMMGGKMMYKKGGFPDLNKDGEVTKADILKGRGVMKNGGKKTMEPGGGGRFAKMVNKMKGEGKSEESAKAIAASIGRKKYGKSKFQEMAAAGKKKMGGKKC